MAFIEISDLADASSFRRRLVPAIATVAGNVLAETPTGKDRKDTKRKELAQRALRDPVATAEMFVWGVLSNPVVAAAGIAATDGDIQYQVNQMWSTIAGVTPVDEAPLP